MLSKATVLLVDSHPLIRAGIRMLMQVETAIVVVAEANNEEEAERLCRAHKPNVVLLNPALSASSLLETMTLLNKGCVTAKIVLISDRVFSVPMQKCISLGLSGYLLYNEVAETAVEAVQAVAEGKTWFSQSTIQQMIRPVARRSLVEDLTIREVQLLHVLARGWSNLQIANEICISERTVRYYLRNICSKLNMESRNELLVWCIESGFGIPDTGFNIS